jgi:hypothetical protein
MRALNSNELLRTLEAHYWSRHHDVVAGRQNELHRNLEPAYAQPPIAATSWPDVKKLSPQTFMCGHANS